VVVLALAGRLVDHPLDRRFADCGGAGGAAGADPPAFGVPTMNGA